MTKIFAPQAACAALISGLLLAVPAAAQSSSSSGGAKPDTAPGAAPPARLEAPPRPDLGNQIIPPPPDPSGIPPAPLGAMPPPRESQPASGREPASIQSASSLSLRFASNAQLPPDEAKALLADVAARLKAKAGERLELHAQAPSRADRVGEGRRLALLRARAVRDQLVDLGVDPARLTVFAETVPTGSPDPDRVDLVFRS